MVIPAELLQVQYAHELRAKIVSSFEHVVVIGFRRLIFPEIQQEVVLLLAEGKRSAPGQVCDFHTIDISDAAELNADVMARRIAHAPARHSRVGMKWTALYLTDSAYKAIDSAQSHRKLSNLGVLASVDVGVVTGLNAFFVLDHERAKQVCAENLSVRVVGRTGALKGVRFGDEDFNAYRESYPSHLLNLTGVAQDRFPKKLVEYIRHGEQNGAHLGYKCRIRRRWVDVPSVYVPDAFLFRQIHAYPLLVVNEAGASSTDTIHRVRLKNGVSARLLAACFVNSLTFAWAEVAGRSYGGGVLELEPREAEELPVPYFGDLELDIDHVDALLRRGEVEAALDYVDLRTLVRRLGFTISQTKEIRSAWRELSNRRIARK
jgi:adenine-specific DNA-methyltransferase